MKCFKVTKNQVNFILKYCSNLIPSESFLQGNNSFIIALTPAQQMQLVDCLTDLFISTGLNNNSEPNNIGLQIEALIDIFNFYRDYTVFSFTKDEWLLISRSMLNVVLHDGSIFDLYLNTIQEANKVILLLNNKEHEMLLTGLHELFVREFLKCNKKSNKVIDKIKKIIGKLQL